MKAAGVPNYLSHYRGSCQKLRTTREQNGAFGPRFRVLQFLGAIKSLNSWRKRVRVELSR